MQRIKAIAPLWLEENELERRQERYDRLAPKGLSVKLVNLEGGPKSFETPYDISVSEMRTLKEIRRTNPHEFDAVLPDCVLDPAVGAGAPVPTYGILRLSASALHGAGRNYLAVTRNQVIGEELGRRLSIYALGSDLAGVATLDINFCFVSDTDGWSTAMEPMAAVARQLGVTTILNGCSAVDMAQRWLGDVEVIDPTELALKMLAIYI